MLSVVAVFLGFISFVLCLIPGLIVMGITLAKIKSGSLPFKRPGSSYLMLCLVVSFLWIMFIVFSVHFPSSGGAPTEESWLSLYKAFAMLGAIPGISLLGGSFIFRLYAFIKKRQLDKKHS